MIGIRIPARDFFFQVRLDIRNPEKGTSENRSVELPIHLLCGKIFPKKWMLKWEDDPNRTNFEKGLAKKKQFFWNTSGNFNIANSELENHQFFIVKSTISMASMAVCEI